MSFSLQYSVMMIITKLKKKNYNVTCLKNGNKEPFKQVHCQMKKFLQLFSVLPWQPANSRCKQPQYGKQRVINISD